MNRKLALIFTIAMITMALALRIPQGTYAQTVTVDPVSVTYEVGVNATIGDHFNVTLWANDVEDVASFQIRMLFNNTFINASTWYEPDWDTDYVFYGNTTLVIPAEGEFAWGTENDLAYAQFSIARFPFVPGDPTFYGTGILAIVEFEITAAPEAGAYSTDIGIDNVNTFLLGSQGGIITVTKENGHVTIIPEFAMYIMLATILCATILVTVSKRSS